MESPHGEPSPPQIRRIEDRINRLRARKVPIYGGPEDLDLPLDDGIAVIRGPRWSNIALMVNGGRASSANIRRYEVGFAGCRLLAGGVAGVSTAMEHRFKSYARSVMVNSLRWMRKAGCDVSLLFGISGFYPKFGYAEVLPQVTFTLNARQAAGLDGEGFRFVAFRREHLPALLAMYRDDNRERTGPIRRDIRTWRPFRKGVRWGLKTACRVALDADEKPAGYFVYDRRAEGARIVEAGFAGPRVFPAIVAATGRLARRRGGDEVVFNLPEDSRLMAWCKRLGIEKRVRHRRDGGGMARMINIPSALGKLAPLLAGRVGGRGRLTIRTNLDNATIAWSPGRASVLPASAAGPQAAMPQWALAQLLYGYADAPELADRGILTGSAEAVRIVSGMFPAGPHFFYGVDEF